MTDRPIDHLLSRLEHLEGGRKKEQEAVDAIEKGVDDAQARLKDLEREINDLRRMAGQAQEQAENVAKALEPKERETAAEARARSLVAKWLQIVLGAPVLIGTLWSSRWLNAIDRVKALLGRPVRGLGPSVLGASIGIAAVAWWPDLAARWRAINEVTAPIRIPEATAHWVNDRQFDIEAPAFYWSDTCPSIWVTWWVQTRWGSSVPVTTHAVEGPFKAKGEMPPRYKISIKPMVGPPLRLRATIPEGLSASDVLLVAVDDVVPDNEPCDSGWSGVMQVFRLQINPSSTPGQSEGSQHDA